MNLYLTDFNQNATLIPIFMHGLAISIMLTVGTLSMLKKKKVCDKRYFIWGRAGEPHSMCCASDLGHNDKGIWSAAGIFITYQFCPAPVYAAVDHPDCQLFKNQAQRVSFMSLQDDLLKTVRSAYRRTVCVGNTRQ
ncbi:hypothetical protein MKD03_13205 [[Clostridium] innocuum]|nr:hypothetical protein [[Clostridium] innocuum]